MLAIISPAKKLDFESDPITDAHTQPVLLKDAEVLANKAKKLKRSDLKSMMSISDNLADLNYQRFQDFKPPFNLANARQAALSFAGDTYVGLDAPTLKTRDLEYAQDHLRILSGLYGVLRPLDLIQPYRLEMGTKFPIMGKENLYDFWDRRVTDELNKATESHKDRRVINLASSEYAKVVKPKALEGGMITPVFKEIKDGNARVLGLFAKRARGMMARYIVTKRVETEKKLKAFNADGYTFQPDQSNDSTWVFSRPQP
ncbi:MAG: peroxide stress protein YaaA [Rhodospirillales bacterium]